MSAGRIFLLIDTFVATIRTRIVDARDRLGGDDGTALPVTRKGGSS
jgi:hypothetical protein